MINRHVPPWLDRRQFPGRSQWCHYHFILPLLDGRSLDSRNHSVPMVIQSKCSFSGEPCFSPVGTRWPCNGVIKGAVCSSVKTALGTARNMERHESSVRMGSLEEVFGCEGGVLVRSNVEWNILTGDRALCKHSGSSFSRSISHARRVKKIQCEFK